MEDGPNRLPRVTRVKNKQPADKQITAEQLLREAKEIQLEDDFKAPKQIITDPDELAEYRLTKRKEYEDLVRRVGRFNAAVWVKVGGCPEHHRPGSQRRHGVPPAWRASPPCLPRSSQGFLLHYNPVPLCSLHTHAQYATWEEQQKDFRRARSVWERALAVEHRNVSMWLKVGRRRG